MYIVAPFIAAFSQAGSATLDKLIISKQGVGFKLYLVASFFLVFLITLPFFIAFGRIGKEATEIYWIGLLIAGVILGSAINFLFYFGLEHQTLTEIQPVRLLAPIFTIILASIVFKEERNSIVILLAILASLTLIWSHIEKRHLTLNKYLLPILLYSVVVSPVGTVVTKQLLTVYSPFAFEFIKSGLVFLVLLFFMRTSFKALNRENVGYLVATNILTTICWILVFYSYTWIGVVRTVLILTLYPMLVYIFARIFLKEKLYWKNIVATIIILICVVYAQTIK